MKVKPIIIVSGEPYSIFSEIFFKTLKTKFIKKYRLPIILIASKKLTELQMKKLNFFFKINLIKQKDVNKLKINNQKINLIDVNFKFKKTFDKISHRSSDYIKKCFEIGLNLMKKDKGIALINGPISKKHFLKKKYLGITDYLAYKTNNINKEVMLIYNNKLSVSPITTHLALKDVHKKVSIKKIVHHVKVISKFYKTFRKKPKFAITGLNPHCESAYTNNEETKIIKPAVKILKNKKINIKGPFPADTLFLKQNTKKFDVIVGMYHDQILTPIKTLFEFDAINITLGLPFIRLSPDHGTNNKMLGLNKSNPTSLKKILIFLNKIK